MRKRSEATVKSRNPIDIETRTVKGGKRVVMIGNMGDIGIVTRIERVRMTEGETEREIRGMDTMNGM
jgi:hypothetical protein